MTVEVEMGQDSSSLADPNSSSERTESIDSSSERIDSRKRGLDSALDIFRSKKLKLEGKSVMLNKSLMETRRVNAEWTSDEEYNKSGTPSPVLTPNSASQDMNIPIAETSSNSEELGLNSNAVKPAQDVSSTLGSDKLRHLLRKKGTEPEKALEFSRYDRGFTSSNSGHFPAPMRGRSYTAPSELSPGQYKRRRLSPTESTKVNGIDKDILSLRNYRPQSVPHYVHEAKYAQSPTCLMKLEGIIDSVSPTENEENPATLDKKAESDDVISNFNGVKPFDGPDGTRNFLDTLLEKTISDVWANSESPIPRKRFGLLYFLHQKNDTGKSHTCQCSRNEGFGSMLSSLLTKRAKPEVQSESEEDSGTERPDTPTWLALYEKDADPEQIAAFARSSRSRKTKKRRMSPPRRRHTLSVLPRSDHLSLLSSKPMLAGTDCVGTIRNHAELFVSNSSEIPISPSTRTTPAGSSVRDYSMSIDSYTHRSKSAHSQTAIYSQAPCAPPPHIATSTDPSKLNNITTKCTFANQLIPAQEFLKTDSLLDLSQPPLETRKRRTHDELEQVRFPNRSLLPGLIKVEPEDIPLPPPLINMRLPTSTISRQESNHFYPGTRPEVLNKSDYNHNDTTMDYDTQSGFRIYHTENHSSYPADGRLYMDTHERMESTYNHELSRCFLPASFNQLQRRKNSQPRRISADPRLISSLATISQSPGVYAMYDQYGNHLTQTVPVMVQPEHSPTNVPSAFGVGRTTYKYSQLMPLRCQDKPYGVPNINDPLNLTCYSK